MIAEARNVASMPLDGIAFLQGNPVSSPLFRRRRQGYMADHEYPTASGRINNTTTIFLFKNHFSYSDMV